MAMRKVLLFLAFVLSLPPLAVTTAVTGWFVAGPSVPRRAEALRTQQIHRWTQDRAALEGALQGANPEFDLMWRLFSVLAACDRALSAPDEADRWLAFADQLIEGAVAVHASEGDDRFLMGYAHTDPWVQPAGSLFVDGEMALMIAARRAVADTPRLAALGPRWTARVERHFELAGADGWPESYPDESWAFCVVNGLLALRFHDVVEGTDHSPMVRRWVRRLAEEHTDPATGLLASDWRADGTPRQGTEGSSLWWVATGLLLLDPALADMQYTGARDQLLGGLPGLAWSREWLGATLGGDIDSGPLVPFFDASPAASGFALVAAEAHDDAPTTRRLQRALRAADLLLVVDPRLAAMDEAPMGDAIVMLGLGFGPLWQAVGPPVTP